MGELKCYVVSYDIMIVDLGPLDGRVEEKIEFMGVHPSQMESKAVVV